jgi:hypothetical protein
MIVPANHVHQNRPVPRAVPPAPLQSQGTNLLSVLTGVATLTLTLLQIGDLLNKESRRRRRY